MSVGKIALQKKKSEKWQQKQAEKEQAQQKQIDEWFEKFDENGNDQLERDELRGLLIHLYPGRVPTEDALNFLIKKATEIDTFSIKIAGNETGSVSREAVRTTVKRYRDYFREQVRCTLLQSVPPRPRWHRATDDARAPLPAGIH